MSDSEFDKYRAQGYVICRMKKPSKVRLLYDPNITVETVPIDFSCRIPLTEEQIVQIGAENIEREL